MQTDIFGCFAISFRSKWVRRRRKSIGTISRMLVTTPIRYALRTEQSMRFLGRWEARGLAGCTEIMASKIPGCTNIICYYGSSTYDTKQMARLIDLVVEDCKQQGIETLTPEELERMALEWRQDEKGNEGDEDYLEKVKKASLGARRRALHRLPPAPGTRGVISSHGRRAGLGLKRIS